MVAICPQKPIYLLLRPQTERARAASSNLKRQSCAKRSETGGHGAPRVGFICLLLLVQGLHCFSRLIYWFGQAFPAMDSSPYASQPV